MINKIKEELNKNKYRFLKELAKEREILFLTLGGSHAYGTAIPTSDIDIRGCAAHTIPELLGMSNFEQKIDNTTDTVVYGLKKFISLCCQCNPNIIEMLGCKPEHYLSISSLGKELLDNKKLFLSKRAVQSFGGYANQQLRRLQNALARDNYPQKEKELHMLGSILTSMSSFNERFDNFEDGSIKVYVDNSTNPELETEIFLDVELKHYPLRDYKNIWSDMHNIVKDYSKLNKRNHKKDDLHLNKHAMHLVRLYLMCLDILEKEEINTFRENDLSLLMAIRSGEFQKEDGTYKTDFFELINELETKLDYAKRNTSLPEHPNMKKIEQLVTDCNMKTILF